MAKQLDPWAEHFRAALVIRVKEPQGKGWMTAKQFCDKAGCGKCKAGAYLKGEVNSGRMERFLGSQVTSNGKACPQTWYRPVAKK